MLPCFRRPAHALLAALLLPAACAAPGDFPSLLPREAERDVSMEEPVREPPSVASDPALTPRVAELLRAARQGQRDFAALHDAAAAAAARAGVEGSESWIEAQQVISRLEAARAETTRALAELNALAVARAALPTNAQDFAAIEAAVQEASELARRQSEAIDGLRRRTNRG